MKVINLLDFLNSVSNLYTLKFAKCGDELVNFLDLMTEDEQFTRKIDLGIVYVNQKSIDQYTIVDGLNRILSLSLLLHAVCECYKKTTKQNESAIKTIRSKYLLHKSKMKLKLYGKDAEIYAKIIDGERLNGHEKETPMFKLLHSFWVQIKEEKLQAASIFKMLQKICITVVETEDVSKRDLYYKINSYNRKLDQLLLIEDFLHEYGINREWESIKAIFNNKDADIRRFLKDFFVTKFNFKKFKPDRLYESFTNYFETMMLYNSEDVLINKIKTSAKLYSDILNVNFKSDNVKQAFIQIKKHSGEDTFAYILDVYKDYNENNITEEIFVEILNTIDEYLRNRKKHDNNIEFNELIQYLNAFITCK